MGNIALDLPMKRKNKEGHWKVCLHRRSYLEKELTLMWL